MRTFDRVRSRPGRGMVPRVGSLMMLGALVLLLYSYSSEANNWKWLTHEGQQEKVTVVEAEPDSKPAKKATEKKNDKDKDAAEPASKESESSTPTAEEKPAEPEIALDTDQDPEQQEAAIEELQAMTDGTLSLKREEMPAYWRFFYWAKNQTAKQMLARAKTVSLNDLLQKPDEQRGKLIKLQLNLRRVMTYESPENAVGVKKVYELWGWSESSKSWLYVGLTSELPVGMPIGPEVYESGTFVGYFLKVQGYHESNSKSGDRPLSSPLLIGRWIWNPPAKIATASTEPWWIWGLLGGLALVVLVACIWPWLRKPPAGRTTIGAAATGAALAQFQNEDVEEPAEPEDDAQSSSSLLYRHGSPELN